MNQKPQHNLDKSPGILLANISLVIGGVGFVLLLPTLLAFVLDWMSLGELLDKISESTYLAWIWGVLVLIVGMHGGGSFSVPALLSVVTGILALLRKQRCRKSTRRAVVGILLGLVMSAWATYWILVLGPGMQSVL